MKKIIFSILFLAIFSSPSIAAEIDYKMCSIAGFLSGDREKFVASVAMRILSKKGLMRKQGSHGADPKCQALWEKAHKLGVAHFIRGRYDFINNNDEALLGADANDFADEIRDAVISNMNIYK
jgi:hypothetical protein